MHRLLPSQVQCKDGKGKCQAVCLVHRHFRLDSASRIRLASVNVSRILPLVATVGQVASVKAARVVVVVAVVVIMVIAVVQVLTLAWGHQVATECHGVEDVAT